MTDEEINRAESGLRVAATVSLVVGAVAGAATGYVMAPPHWSAEVFALAGAGLGLASGWVAAAPLRGLAAVIALLGRLAEPPK